MRDHAGLNLTKKDPPPSTSSEVKEIKDVHHHTQVQWVVLLLFFLFFFYKGSGTKASRDQGVFQRFQVPLNSGLYMRGQANCFCLFVLL